MSALRIGLCGLLIFSASAIAAAAEMRGEGEVSGTGSASITKPPQILRVQVELSADGRDAKDALEKLNAKKETARKKLLELGAAEKTVQSADLRIGSTQRQQIEVLRSRIPRPGRAATTQPAKAPVTLSCNLKAEWKLTGKSADELVVEGATLQEKIRAANPAGEGSGEGGEADEELREEMDLLSQRDPSQARSPLTFVYVAKIAPEERAKALGEAFAKATTHAAALAKAAGRELGPVRQLQAQASVENPPEGQMYYSPFGGYRSYSQQPTDSSADEAIGANPTSVTVQVGVSASFNLK